MAPTLEQCTTCIGDLLVDFKRLGEGSKIASCLCQDNRQVHQGQSPQLDANQLRQFEELIQQFFDSQDQVNELPDTEYQTNDLHYEQLSETPRESSGSQGRVDRRQNGGLPKITARQGDDELFDLADPLISTSFFNETAQGLQEGAGNFKAALQNAGVALNQALAVAGNIGQDTIAGLGQTVGQAPKGIVQTVNDLERQGGPVTSLFDMVFGS